MVVLLSVCVQAQNDVTRFLGIPVDGTKSAMIQKLIEKGTDILKGEFNGREVDIQVVTHNAKVWRICVWFCRPETKKSLNSNYNDLCRQFNKNEKYIRAYLHDYVLSEEEDVDNNYTLKNYQAVYYQQPQNDSLRQDFLDMKEMSLNYERLNLKDSLSEDEFALRLLIVLRYRAKMEKFSNNVVWFTILRTIYSNYHIAIYYDNLFNKNDDDL